MLFMSLNVLQNMIKIAGVDVLVLRYIVINRHKHYMLTMSTCYLGKTCVTLHRVVLHGAVC